MNHPAKRATVGGLPEAWEAFIARNFHDYGEDLDTRIPLDFAELHGIELLACGWGRCAFLLPDGTVLKMAYRREGRVQTGYECLRWERATKKERRHYATVLACDLPLLEDPRDWDLYPDQAGRGWVLMEYVEPISKAEFNRRAQKIRDVARTLGIRDVHWENVGLRKGTIVFLDYGDKTIPDDILVLNPESANPSVEFEVEGHGSSMPSVEAFYEGEPIGGVELRMIADAPPVCADDWEKMRERLDQLGASGAWSYAVVETFLDEEWRGQGIGRAMYEAALSELSDEGEPVILVPSWCLGGTTSRAARRVWQSLARQYESSGEVVTSMQKKKKNPAVGASIGAAMAGGAVSALTTEVAEELIDDAQAAENPADRSLIRLGFEGEGWFGVGSSQGIWLVVEGGRAIGGVRTDFEDSGPVFAAGWDPHEALDLAVSKGEWQNWYRLFPTRDRWETFDVPCTYASRCAISEREVASIKRRVLR